MQKDELLSDRIAFLLASLGLLVSSLERLLRVLVLRATSERISTYWVRKNPLRLSVILSRNVYFTFRKLLFYECFEFPSETLWVSLMPSLDSQ